MDRDEYSEYELKAIEQRRLWMQQKDSIGYVQEETKFFGVHQASIIRQGNQENRMGDIHERKSLRHSKSLRKTINLDYPRCGEVEDFLDTWMRQAIRNV